MSERTTIGLVGTGDMGAAVGGALVRAGHRVVTAGQGRSAASRAAAAAAGIEDVGSLEAVMGAVRIALSIVPPAAARQFAVDAVRAMDATGARPTFVDCNAVAPASVREIERIVARAGAEFLDVGIVGRGPKPGGERTRFYVSGAARQRVLGLHVPEIELVDLGPEIGTASALKMAYSALNKGTDALLAAVLVAAERLGVRAPLMRELAGSQADALKRMRARVPFLGSTAKRYAPEMAEIAATYASVGVTPEFHRGAEWLYALLATTPYAAETRATQPRERSLDEAVAVYAAAVTSAAAEQGTGAMSEAVPYENLTPDVVIRAAESCGHECTGSILALASYENRVYQIATTEGFVVAKFYRPGRWTTDAILEEHDFALELAAQEIPVVPPLVHDGYSLFEEDGYRFALYERRGGRWPELGTKDDREWLGRFLGRIHMVGSARRFTERQTLSWTWLGEDAVNDVLEGDWLPDHLVASYENVTEQLLDSIVQIFDDVGAYRTLRIHGDCHRNNVLWTDKGPHFVDLDDCMNGPAVQDLWLFLAGSRDEMSAQLGDILEGYTQFFDFDYGELRLVEALRALRLMHYTAWITRRWEDPAFPRAFPWLGEPRYWEEHVQALLEQRAVLDDPPLAVVV